MISREEVERTAALAHLTLTDQELEKMTGELASILDAVSSLQEVDTSAVVPTNHAVPLENVMRRDEQKPGLSRDEAVANGPDVVQSFFRVPRIMEEE